MPTFISGINMLVCRVPIGTHQSATDNHRTAPWTILLPFGRDTVHGTMTSCSHSVATPFMACTVLYISHPFGVIYRSPLNSFSLIWVKGVRRVRGWGIWGWLIVTRGDYLLCTGALTAVHKGYWERVGRRFGRVGETFFDKKVVGLWKKTYFCIL